MTVLVVRWSMFVDDPGISIVGIDPGTTTGVAVWDAWDKVLYVDHIDAGRGRRYKEHVFGGIVESEARAAAKRVVKPGTGELAVLDEIERGVSLLLSDMIRAAGPRTVVVCEDFILGYGGGDAVRSSDRSGLSPVRLRTRVRQRAEDDGLLTGDAWRVWDGFGTFGADGRGIKLGAGGAVMHYKRRLTDVEKFRLGGWVDGSGGGALWAGGGIRWVDRLPGTRNFVGGDHEKTVRWMRDAGLWRARYPHGMDALMHLVGMAEKIGVGVQGPPELIWQGMTVAGKKVSAKSG